MSTKIEFYILKLQKVHILDSNDFLTDCEPKQHFERVSSQNSSPLTLPQPKRGTDFRFQLNAKLWPRGELLRRRKRRLVFLNLWTIVKTQRIFKSLFKSQEIQRATYAHHRQIKSMKVIAKPSELLKIKRNFSEQLVTLTYQIAKTWAEPRLQTHTKGEGLENVGV